MTSIKAQTNIEKLLNRVYGINQIKGVFPIGKGEWNSIFKIEATSNLVLRISHIRKKEPQLAFELDVMTHVAKSLSVVPKIELTKNGGLYHNQNGVFYTLFEFKEGKPISINLESVKQAGKLLGRIHRVLREYSQEQRYLNGFSIIDFDWEDNYFFSGDTLVAAAEIDIASPGEQKQLAKIVENSSFLREAGEFIKQWVDNSQRHSRFTESIVHGDYYKGNLLVEGHSITAVLDWDETTTSWLEYEVANAMWEFSRDDSRLHIDPERSTVFLESYKSEIDDLTLDEQSLVFLIAFRRLVEIHFELYRFLHGEPHDFDYAYLNVLYLHNLLSGGM